MTTTTVITIIYNEEYLLPFWLNHHKKLFDNIIIIDYESTDNSIQIIKDNCPNAKIITSKNKNYGSRDTDFEIMEIEKNIEGIKIVLNITEFLFVKKPIKELFESYKNKDNFSSYKIISYSPYSSNNYEINNNKKLFSNLLNDDVFFNIDSKHFRELHNYPSGNYLYKRKGTYNISQIITDAYIIWFGFYPMNGKMIKRKLQIKDKILKDDNNEYNSHHYLTENEFKNIINMNVKNSTNLKTLNNDLYNLIVDNDNDNDEREIKYNSNQLNLAFVTYFYGSENNISYLIPKIPSQKYNCYYYTNNKSLLEKLKDTKWISIFDNKITNDDLVESSMASKHLKAMPQEFKLLKKYDFICSYDNKLDINDGGIENLVINELIKNNYGLAIREHKFVTSYVWHEFALSMLHERYRKQSEKMKDYIYKQLANGLSERTELHYENNIIVRNMRHPKMIEFNETWYSHIKECGIECQIALFFVKQLFPKDFIYTIR